MLLDFQPNADAAKSAVLLTAGETQRRKDKITMGGVILLEQRMVKKPSYSLNSHRVREIETLIKHRHGHGVPETDDGDVYALAVAHAYQALATKTDIDPAEYLKGWCSVWAKWLPHDRIAQILGEVTHRKHDLSAASVAELLNVKWVERERLNFRRIGACDLTKTEFEVARKARKRERDRLRVQQKRRASGSVSRAVYEAGSLSKQKPWELDGVSRRTWERRRAKAAQNVDLQDVVASPSRIDIETTCDTLASNEGQGTGPTPPTPSMQDNSEGSPETEARLCGTNEELVAGVCRSGTNATSEIRRMFRLAGFDQTKADLELINTTLAEISSRGLTGDSATRFALAGITSAATASQCGRAA